MKKRLSLALAVVMALSMVLSACGNQNQPNASGSSSTGSAGGDKPSGPVSISFGTASVGGNYYVLGAGIAAIWNEKIPEYVSVTPEATGGSGANVGLVQNGDCQVAMTVDNTAYNGYNGLSWANGQKYDSIRTMFAMMPSALEMVATKSSGITSIDQFKDATVCIGPATSGGNLAFAEILSVLPELAYKNKVDLSWSDCVTQMSDGLVDLMIDYGTFPHSARTELVTNNECVWINLSDEQIKKVCDAYPYYYEGSEPAGTYKYMDEEYPSILCNNIMFCSKDLDEETVYQMVKCTFENLDEWALSSSAVDYVNAEAITSCSVPLHPGAIRYFEEIGIQIPESLYPPEYKC